MVSLKEARESKGIKQLAVANALNISRQTYAKYEIEPSQMTIKQAQTACAFIGVPFDSVFFGKSDS